MKMARTQFSTVTLILIFSAIFLIVFWYGTQIYNVFTHPFFAYNSDEMAYVHEAESFAQNGTLHGVNLLREATARVGDFGTHGFAYAIVNGTLLKINPSQHTMLLFN